MMPIGSSTKHASRIEKVEYQRKTGRSDLTEDTCGVILYAQGLSFARRRNDVNLAFRCAAYISLRGAT